MHTTLLALLLAGSAIAAPTPDPTTAEEAAPVLEARASNPTCVNKLINFDELGNSNGKFRSLPGAGYDYFGLEMRENNWAWLSKGPQLNGDWTADDRPVPQPEGYQTTNVTTKSGNNALISLSDGYAYSFSPASRSGSKLYIDLKSMWIHPEYPGKAYSFKATCDTYSKGAKTKTWNVPALPEGQYYQLTFPSDWAHVWRCTLGATNLQQFLMDDFSYCLYDIPYAQTIPSGW